MSLDELKVGTVLKGRYRLEKFLGHGSFGSVYKCIDQEYDVEMAIKVELTTHRNPRLIHEGHIYEHLEGGKGIPRIEWFGREGIYNLMVMQLLGPSVRDMFYLHDKSFTMKTVLMVADQVLGRVKFCHENHILHRDIKPANLVLGLGKMEKLIYMVDFGLAKKYIDNVGSHIPYREGRGMTGTPKYASVNAHRGKELSRRDDLESVGYMMMQLLNRELPWLDIKTTNDMQGHERSLEKSLSIPVEDLCRGLPTEFITYLTYCRHLRFDENPDYSRLRTIFRKLLQSRGFELDFEFDWIVFKVVTTYF